jgi:tetratricopeptide (TPR) repeat protein
VERVDSGLEPWIPLLGILLGLELPSTAETAAIDERFLRETLADVAGRFLSAALGDAPTLLLVEDAQFLDEASSDLLRRLSRAPSPPHVLVVTHSDTALMWAPTGDDAPPYLALTLLPLSEQHMREIVEIATDAHPLLPQDVEKIAARSGGNTLFLFELLDLVGATGSTDALPDSVESLVAGEIDQLAPADRSVLRYASVLGATFDPAFLAVALDGEVALDAGLWERLRGLVDENPDGGMQFRNTLVRDAAYEGLPFRRRRQLHNRVAEAMESAVANVDEESSALALHFYEARRPEKAWRYCRLAGDRARAVAANVEAARFYERALEAARSMRDVSNRERAEVWVALGAVRERAGLFDSSFGALRRATGLLVDDPVEQARVFALRTMARWRRDAYTSALRETTAGLRLVEGVETTPAVGARAMLRAMRSAIRCQQGHPREAIAIAEIAVAEAELSQELEALTHAYTALDESYQTLGEPEKAVHERKSVDILTMLGNTRQLGIVQLNLGVQAHADGRWDEAIDLFQRAQRDCTRAGDRQHTAVAAAALGEVLIERGLLDEGERVLVDARRALRSSGFIRFAVFAEMKLASVALARGNAAGALESLTRILDESENIGHAAITLDVAIHFAHAASAAGFPARGLEVMDEAARVAGRDAVLLSVPLDRVRGIALSALGHLDEARSCFERALAGARKQSLPYEQLLLLRERVVLARRTGTSPNPDELREACRLAQLLGIETPAA